MNPHAAQSTSPFTLYRSLKANRSLIYNLIKREVIGRYHGSAMGLLWSFFNPVLMLVFTRLCSAWFSRCGGWAALTQKLNLPWCFCACLMVFNLFSECVNRTPSLVLGNVNYIKKVVFPLEIQPVVALDSAAFHLFISLFVWLIFYLVFFGVPQATIFLLPLELLPLVLMTLGLSWLLASLGMYLRDVTQIIGVVTTMMMFLSPIFYPIVALPEEYRSFMQISPLTPVVEQTHDVMISGKDLDWSALAVYLLLSSMIAWLSFAWFQKTRKRFADVL